MLDPDSTTPIIVLIILLLTHAFFAAAAEAVAFLRRPRRLQLIEEGNSSAQLIDYLAENPTLLLTTEQLILKSLGFFMVALAIFIYTDPLVQAVAVSSWTAVLMITAVAALITLFLGELIPKEIARQNAEFVALWAFYPLHWLSYLAAPLAHLVAKMGRVLSGNRGGVTEYDGDVITEEDLRSYLDVGEETGVLKEEEKEMISSIFDLDDTTVREIMVPRIDIIAIDVESSVDEALDIMIKAGHSRVPVYRDSIDNVVGVLYVKDLVAHWLKEGEKPRSIQGLEREVYYVPETKSVSDLLHELQTKKVHIAIVVDEYGGTAGLVTIEDVLEEIVGEIQDEHDMDEFFMQHISDDEYIFSARMDLDDINDLMSIDLPTDESDTLGGLIYDLLGRIPKPGDVLRGEAISAPDLQLTVLEVEGRRIKTVRIKRINNENNLESSQAVPNKKASTLVNEAQNTLSNSAS